MMGAGLSEFSLGLCLCQMRKGVGVMAPVMASMRRLYLLKRKNMKGIRMLGPRHE